MCNITPLQTAANDPNHLAEAANQAANEAAIEMYRAASKAKPLGLVLANLMPSYKWTARAMINCARTVDLVKFFHEQQFLPNTGLEMNFDLIDLEASAEGKWVTLHFMEYNGSWKTPHIRVFVNGGNKADYFLTDLSNYQTAFDKIGLGKDQVGKETAFIITDADDKPVYPHVDFLKTTYNYVLHVAIKHVRFVYVDDDRYKRELLAPVIYGEPSKQLDKRIRAGLGVADGAAVTMLRGETPMHPEFRNFRFSRDLDDIDTVNIRVDLFCAQTRRFDEYPVERIPMSALNLYTDTQLVEHYWFTTCADIAIPRQMRPGIRFIAQDAEEPISAAALPLKRGEARARDRTFNEYAPDLRRAVVRLAMATAGHRDFVVAALSHCLSLRLHYPQSQEWTDTGFTDVVELLPEDVNTVRRAIELYGGARTDLLRGRMEEWQQAKLNFEHGARLVYFKERMAAPSLSDDSDDRIRALLGWITWQDDVGFIRDHSVFHPKYPF